MKGSTVLGSTEKTFSFEKPPENSCWRMFRPATTTGHKPDSLSLSYLWITDRAPLGHSARVRRRHNGQSFVCFRLCPVGFFSRFPGYTAMGANNLYGALIRWTPVQKIRQVTVTWRHVWWRAANAMRDQCESVYVVLDVVVIFISTGASAQRTTYNM